MARTLPRPGARGPALAAAALLLTAACSVGDDSSAPAPSPTSSSAAARTDPTDPTPSPTPSPTTPEPGTVPPDWLGTRVLAPAGSGPAAPQDTPPELDPRRFTLPDAVAPLPGEGYAADVVSPAPADVVARSTWREGCPVAATDLAWVRVAFVGFDGARHTGELLLADDVADDLVAVFEDLWEARFPIEEMRVTTAAELDAAPTGDGNNTESFVCRATTGGSEFSQHAYGTAVDVNPFQNPYLRERDGERVVIPELATSYLDREDVRPGMVLPGDAVTSAFAAIGWEWGGAWRTLKDYQHFSRNGR